MADFSQESHQGLGFHRFFVVPTITFQLLFTFVILSHDRRRLVHFAVTANPTAEWTARQLLQAFPWDHAPRYVLRDRDRAYGLEFSEMAKCMGIHEVLTAPRSPWQNAHLVTSTRAKLPDRSGLLKASRRTQDKPYARLPCEV
jgi:hypothetical protein